MNRINTDDTFLINRLNQYKTRLDKERHELRRLPAGRLGFRDYNGNTEYVHLQNNPENGNLIRKGITRDKHLIAKMARKMYLQASIKLLQKEISMLERYLKKHIEPSPRNILDSLPEKFRNLPEEMFFPRTRAAKAWQNMPYEKNDFPKEEKAHITSKGLRVRSKSELIIAEMLDEFGIPYRYEMLLHFENMTFCPDFTININGKIYYWEHCGLMSDPNYRKHNLWKISQYEKMEIVPWDNLIITYDNEDGTINSAIIEAEIINKLLS